MVQDALAANRERLEIELEGKNRVLEAERLEAHLAFSAKKSLQSFVFDPPFIVSSLFCF